MIVSISSLSASCGLCISIEDVRVRLSIGGSEQERRSHARLFFLLPPHPTLVPVTWPAVCRCRLLDTLSVCIADGERTRDINIVVIVVEIQQ